MAIKTVSDFTTIWANSFNAGEIDPILDMYPDDLVVVAEAGTGARVHGKAELRAVIESYLALAPCTLAFGSDAIVEGTDTTLFMGSWTFDGVSPDGPVHIEARATVVFKLTDDGYVAVIDDFFSQG